MDVNKIVIHRGLCGAKLRSQCLGIGFTYIVISITAILYTSVEIHHPLQFVDLEEMRTAHTPITVQPPQYNNSNGLDIQAEIETDTNQLEKMVDDLAHSIREFYLPPYYTRFLSKLVKYITVVIQFTLLWR